MKVILHWLVLTVAVYVLPYVMSGVHVDTFIAAVVAGAILGFINMIVKPIITIFTLPLNILTLGLFSFVLNGLFFWFVAGLIDGLTIDNFKAACIGALILAVLNWLGNKLIHKE